MKTNETKNNEEELKEPKDQPRTSQEEPAETDGQTGSEEAEQPSELEQTQQQLEELKDKFLRLSAEFDNYRKRTLKEKAETGTERKREDHKQHTARAGRHGTRPEEHGDGNRPGGRQAGRRADIQQIHIHLAHNGVKTIETKEQPLNTDYHEAIAVIPPPGKS